jgi:hypothetical protein
MRWKWYVVCVGGEKSRILIENSEGKTSFGKTMHRWEDDIKMDRKHLLRSNTKGYGGKTH